MARFTTLLSVSLPLALLAGGALGQTVADYEAALAAAPVSDAISADSVAYCRPLTNYVFTSIPGGERSGLVLPLYTFNGADGPGIADKRAACGEVRKQALIAFDGGTGQQIVTPAEAMEGPTDRGPYYKDPAADFQAPHTGRATPRQPMPRGGATSQ
ncbi:hypothetical protein [Azospirillum doebereinerae]|uniref:Uncharacterized protein n=1 Tax=Azospirillum doebereinerae TaxID=92933 RepID=A0A3S1CIA7_9PROT|nr:hypothetical protein [Azospirillum doebereinerae]MCG5239348.1 hypothetical protein [Azospirillum doebereinerae]RUQ74036.1 hypothetical protein EJ913_06615 [Azospirillum doebereinerae]